MAMSVDRASPLEVGISAGSAVLNGSLELPAGCNRVVLFAHGSGSSRFSARNRFVARELSAAGIGTLLFDLLTPEEDTAYETRFNIGLLKARLACAADWLRAREGLEDIPVGLFGASTGAAAALKVAATSGANIGAVVSRGGRPDLAGADLESVSCPTLLIVGGRDYDVLRLNRGALEQLTCEKSLEIVPGATHLFEEPGALQKVARFAVDWFDRHL